LVFTQLSTDASVLQQTYQMLNSQLQSLRITQEGQTADAKVISTAAPVNVPIAPQKNRMMMYSIALGLIAAIGIALLLDMWDNRIYTDEEAQRITGLPVLAHVPMEKEESRMTLLPEEGKTMPKTSPLLESFRMLRANLLFSAVDKPMQAILVTSTIPGEGKSHSALNLAIAAASGGDRVILVDLDLRRPTIHRLLELPNVVGFSTVVTGQTAMEDALQETNIAGLKVLSSGPVPPDPFKLLNSHAARMTLESLRPYADLIVVDSPPMLGLADARLIGSWMDGTLLVVSCADVARNEVSKAAEVLQQSGVDVLGTVLTKVSVGPQGYYYYYGYRYYGKYMDDGGSDSRPAIEAGSSK
jgi:receptor protein-tyrosine kinase